jgi:hypothetical protein
MFIQESTMNENHVFLRKIVFGIREAVILESVAGGREKKGLGGYRMTFIFHA